MKSNCATNVFFGTFGTFGRRSDHVVIYKTIIFLHSIFFFNPVGCGITEFRDGKWFAKLYTCNYGKLMYCISYLFSCLSCKFDEWLCVFREFLFTLHMLCMLYWPRTYQNKNPKVEIFSLTDIDILQWNLILWRKT